MAFAVRGKTLGRHIDEQRAMDLILPMAMLFVTGANLLHWWGVGRGELFVSPVGKWRIAQAAFILLTILVAVLVLLRVVKGWFLWPVVVPGFVVWQLLSMQRRRGRVESAP